MPELKAHEEPGFVTEYRGWKIWKWTGWKGNKFPAEHPGECRICGKAFEIGDPLYRNQAMDDAHWRCEKGSDDAPNYVCAQWVAEKDGKHICSSYPGEQTKLKRGDSFDITPQAQQLALTDSDKDARNRDTGKRQSFNDLLKFIDQTENTQRHDD